MPSLRKIADSPSKEAGKRSRRKLNVGERPATAADGDDCCNDDRFSQPPDNLDESRKRTTKISASRAVPFSIAAAIRNRRSVVRASSNDGNARIGNGGNSSATDIVAVALSTATQQAPPPTMLSSKTPKTSNGTRMHVLIGDPSLNHGQCARVSMTVSPSTITSSLASLLGMDGMGGRVGVDVINSPETSRAKEDAAQTKSVTRLGQLQPGDVVRWNRLEVRNEYDCDSPGKKQKQQNNEDDTANDLHHPLLNVACDLATSWRDPAAGPSLARLCRIVPKLSSTSTLHSPGQKQQHGERYDLEWEKNIPPSVDVSKAIVEELANWYCANAMPHFSKSTAILPTSRPCQRRNLRDINAPNMLSHIVVKVLRCEKATPRFATPRKATKDPVITHATLSDGPGSDDLLGFGGNHGRIGSAMSSLPKSVSTVFLEAMNGGTHVLVTHVLSQSMNPALQGRESLALVPTRETTALILTPDHPYYVRGKSRREEENPFASQPLTLERASELYSLTQQNSPPIIKDASMPSTNRGAMVVVAPLMDIIVDGVDSSLVEGSFWNTPHKLSTFLIDSPSISTGMKAIKLSPSYRSATLVLDPKSVSSEIVVNADADAMKLLCLDVPVQDMVLNDPTVKSNQYLSYVGQLLKALCSGNVLIRWVLEQESETSWFVTNATLLEL